MFDSFTGAIVHVCTQGVALQTMGVSFSIFVPRPDVFVQGREETVFVHFYWNQESGPQLFGFKTRAEKSLFAILLSATGVGPRLALAILRDLSPAVVVDALVRSDTAVLSTISGVGRKKAEGLIVALKDKVSDLAATGIFGTIENSTQVITDVVKTLEALNYERTEVARAIDAVSSKESIAGLSMQQLLKLVLRELAQIK